MTDEQWERLQPLLPQVRTGPEAKRGDRLFIDAVLYRATTGVRWRDIPGRFGPWKTIYNRFDRWAKLGIWAELFKALQMHDDVGSIVRAHQDAAGGKGGSNAMLWAALEEVLQPNSTPSSTRKRGRSTSR